MFNSATNRCPRTGRVVNRQKPQQSDLQWIIGFVVVGAILGALTSGVELPFAGKPAVQAASVE